jgi:uncharacterized protein
LLFIYRRPIFIGHYQWSLLYEKIQRKDPLTEHEMFALISRELGIRENQVQNTIDLLDTENTIPFISRYRKEMTGSLDEEQIRTIGDRIRYLRALEERKKTVLKSIEDQGKLTPELEEKIRAALKLQEVEDLYLPYKPKRRTRATIAREKGLEPLAEIMVRQEQTEGDPKEIAAEYIDPEKDIHTAEDALSGARDIIAEIISEDSGIRKHIRTASLSTGMVRSESIADHAAQEYEIYVDFSEPVKSIPPHRILAVNRGERENALRVWIDVPVEEIITDIEKSVITNPESIFSDELKKAVSDSYQRLIAPSMQREIRNQLTERADEHAIEVFARNLKALLLTPPMKEKIILGIDPGFRTGCKVAVIDETGKYLAGNTIYPHAPKGQWNESKQTVKSLIETHSVDVIAIGNGTASRETEKLTAEIIHEVRRTVVYTIVNEAGASVYSASAVARKEFPGLEASMRGNISIARRVLDPLSELVKIDPKSIGVGLYQHDVNQVKLSESLDRVVESCVNGVGVDLNTASASLLNYVSGINSRVAENIVKYREEHGKFPDREHLKAIKGLGENSFIQAAGFLRVPESDLFFDRTAVHPESYTAAHALLDHLQLEVNDVIADGTLLRKKIKETDSSIPKLAVLCSCGKETLADIVESLEKPQRDPRDEMDKPVLRSDVLSMDDLYEGMILKGTVRNVVDFGAFVDIGVKQDGLVHLSQMSSRYVKNPLDLVSVGDVIEVRVLSIDKQRGRIGLSMILDESGR